MYVTTLSSIRRLIVNLIKRYQVHPVTRKVKDDNLTYLTWTKLQNIEYGIKRVQEQRVHGDFWEAGVALGGSAIVMSILKEENRRFQAYDVFSSIPPPSTNDGPDAHQRYEEIKAGKAQGLGEDTYYGYKDNLYEEVVANFQKFGLRVDGRDVTLHKGKFQETMTISPETEIAFAHIDCDWYEPVSYVLSTIYPALNVGGILVIDDYHDFSGCRRAVDEFMDQRLDIEMILDRQNVLLHKVADSK